MEFFDICSESGLPTGETVSRRQAHEKGILHRTAHVWILRKREGRRQVLLQKRSRQKDSYPGMYDTSSAGHIPAGEEPLPSALRELREELGIAATEDELRYAGHFRIEYQEQFHHRQFRDNEYVHVFVYTEPVDKADLTLQKSEVEDADWFDLQEVWREIQGTSDRFCVAPAGMRVLLRYLGEEPDRI